MRNFIVLLGVTLLALTIKASTDGGHDIELSDDEKKRMASAVDCAITNENKGHEAGRTHCTADEKKHGTGYCDKPGGYCCCGAGGAMFYPGSDNCRIPNYDAPCEKHETICYVADDHFLVVAHKCNDVGVGNGGNGNGGALPPAAAAASSNANNHP